MAAVVAGWSISRHYIDDDRALQNFEAEPKGYPRSLQDTIAHVQSLLK